MCPGVLGPRIEGVQDCQWWGGAAWAKYHPPRFKRCQISLPHMCRLHASSECHMHESWSNLSKLNLKQGQKSPWRALDLFSGTGSVATVLRGLGWEVTTLDSNLKAQATLQIDVLQWEYWKLPRGHFQLVAAGPPCQEYSIAQQWGSGTSKRQTS